MADRGNVPDAGKVHSRSEEDIDTVDTTDYPFSAYHFNSLSPEYDDTKINYHRQSELNPKFQANWVSKRNVTGKDDFHSKKSEKDRENSLKCGKSDEAAGSIDFIEYLGLSDDGGSNKTKTKNEENFTVTDIGTDEEITTEVNDADEVDEQQTLFKRFFKNAHLFFRNIICRSFDFSPPTPRE